jgi:hypothetical protein
MRKRSHLLSKICFSRRRAMHIQTQPGQYRHQISMLWLPSERCIRIYGSNHPPYLSITMALSDDHLQQDHV